MSWVLILLDFRKSIPAVYEGVSDPVVTAVNYYASLRKMAFPSLSMASTSKTIYNPIELSKK